MQREYPEVPLIAVGALIVHERRVLLVRRGQQPLKGQWTLPGGLLESGETLAVGIAREVKEETGLVVEPIELIELLDRIHVDGDRIRYHYVIADYLCRVVGGELRAASDADDVRWIDRSEWHCQTAEHGKVHLDSILSRVLEAGWQAAQKIDARADQS